MKSFYTSLFPALVLISLLLSSRPAAAQFLWQRAVGTATRGETAEYMVAVPGGFVTAGQSGNITVSDNSGLYLSKVNYTGDTLWTHRITFANVHIFYPRGLIVDAGGNLVVAAFTFTPPASPTAPASVSQGLLVKLTATGDTLWTRPLRNPAGAALTSVTLGNDGSYVAIGSFGNTLPVLHKFSPAGALLWSQLVPYDNTRPGYLQTLVAVPAGYLVCSDPYVLGLPPKFITVNETGNYQFERSCWCGAIQMRLDAQGNVLAAGANLTKLTAQGDSLWSRSYQQYGQQLALARVVELPNGRYLAAGERLNGPTRDVGFIVVDRNGNRLRDTLLVRNGDENVAGVAFTPAGHYVVALGSSLGPIGYADQLLFAYRSWDRLLPTATRQPAPLARLTAFPNPTTDELTLVAADAHPITGQWALYDMLGCQLQAGTWPGLPYGRLSLHAQPAGFYLLRVRDEQRHTTQTLRLEKA